MYKNNNVGAGPVSTQKGITLIALVITIIVMLILVGVTISMAVNGGLFNYAGQAVGQTNTKLQEEGELAEGGVTVNGTYYNSIDDYLAGRPAVFSYDETAKDEKGLLTAKATYTDGVEEKPAIIPAGYKIVNNGELIANGIVIADSNGNEFVWIPVEKAIVTEAEIAKIKEDNTDITTDLAAVQKMVDGGTYPMAVQVGENYKGILYNFSGTDTLTLTVNDWMDARETIEPVNLSGSATWSSETTVNGTTVAAGTSYLYDSQDMFTLFGVGTYTNILYQESYNKMVESVAENGGFYVGRYEISSGTYTLEDGSTVTYAQSKSDQTALTNTEWYNMYKYERDYAAYNSNLGVTSEMIWGSQWDQMMIFVNGKNDGSETPKPFYVSRTGGRLKLLPSATGMNAVDKVANIFDLEANMYEWTQAGVPDVLRLSYRTDGDWFGAASGRVNGTLYSSGDMSSRTSLYIK